MLASRCSALLAVGLAPLVWADLPVHCLRHQVLGEWEFTLGQMSTQRTSCGHLKPDKQTNQPAIKLDGATTTKRVTLASPNLASTSSDTNGHWTMIYDEAVEVKVEGLTLFAFSKFDLWTENGQQKNMSHCDGTQLGWYQTTDRKQFGCYYGRLVDQVAAQAPQMHAAAPGVPPKTPGYDVAMDANSHKAVADNLNLIQTGWGATVYDHMVGKTPRELNTMSGIRRTLPLSDQSSPVSLMATKLHLRRMSGSESLDANAMGWQIGPDAQASVASASLPETMDWRHADGKNYLEPVIDQGDCGSCYTVSTVRMLSARNKIKQKDPSLMPFSISFPLYCAEYNQGCDGGYAFLTTKWSADVGLVPATCAKYTTSGSCSIDPACLNDVGASYRATDHHYVGGYYGGANEQAMMHELVESGPLVVSLEPKSDLMYYQHGIYKSLPDAHVEWERVDHAVLLVGYGEENGQKYWTLQNSWGADWGESGFFRIARGENDSGVESIAVAADVVEDDRPDILKSFVQAVL